MDIKESIYRYFGEIVIPKHLIERDYPIIVHLSDTPSSIYRALDRMLKKLKPEYIVHTGDMVDNIKLELYPYKLDLFEQNVKKIISICEFNSSRDFFIAAGNHDNITIIEKLTKNKVISTAEYIEVEDIKIAIGHRGLDVRALECMYHMFGHDLLVPTSKYHEKWYLNGIEKINIINIYTGEVEFIDYPRGTTESRLNMHGFGI